jgi:hypothetical protein
MSVYKRGATYWFKFRINGQLIRESAHTDSKSIARDAERARRRQLEQSVNGIIKRERMPLFKVAAEEWLKSKVALTPLGRVYYRQYVGKLVRHLGACLVSDITAADIVTLQRKRQKRRPFRPSGKLRSRDAPRDPETLWPLGGNCPPCEDAPRALRHWTGARDRG